MKHTVKHINEAYSLPDYQKDKFHREIDSRLRDSHWSKKISAAVYAQAHTEARPEAKSQKKALARMSLSEKLFNFLGRLSAGVRLRPLRTFGAVAALATVIVAGAFFFQQNLNIVEKDNSALVSLQEENEDTSIGLLEEGFGAEIATELEEELVAMIYL